MSVTISSYTVSALVCCDVQAAWAAYGGTDIRTHTYICMYVYIPMHVRPYMVVFMSVHVYVRTYVPICTVCTVKYAVVIFSVCSLSGCAGWMCVCNLNLLSFHDILFQLTSLTQDWYQRFCLYLTSVYQGTLTDLL